MNIEIINIIYFNLNNQFKKKKQEREEKKTDDLKSPNFNFL